MLVLGGYGAVGTAVCEALVETFGGRIVVAGRDPERAGALARRLGPRVGSRRLDAADASTYPALVDGVAVVVNCVELEDAAVAAHCLARGVHYVDVSATLRVLEGIAALHGLAARGGATAVLSVGVAPGLTNLLTAHARSRLGALIRADLVVLLGLGEAHGEAAVRWVLQRLGRRFAVAADGGRTDLRSFVEGRSASLPAPFGERTAYRFDFSDQHTLRATLGIPTVATWLCFDSRLATALARLLALSGIPAAVPLWRASGAIARVAGSLVRGGTSFVVQVDAVARGGGSASFALSGRGEATTTGRVAAHVGVRLAGRPAPPGVVHIEQLLGLDELLGGLGCRVRFTERWPRGMAPSSGR